MVTLVIFLIKYNLNRHIKHENLLSVYENMDYFEIMLFTVTCWKFQRIQQPYIKRYFYVFFSTNIVEILLKLRADASSGSDGVKARYWGSNMKKINNGGRLLIFYMMEGIKKVNWKNGILWLFSVTDPPKIQDGCQI